MFKSERISKTSKIYLNGSFKEVFPLFGPVREMVWAPGWDPEIVYSTSNDVDEYMVFKSPAHLEEGEKEYIWTLSKYEPDRGALEYTVFTPERLWTITVLCQEDSDSNATTAVITYSYTGLTEKGNELNKRALQLMYDDDLKDWEEAINHYLKTGQMISH